MSYATTLYAIDLGRLRAAIGSKDPKLLRKLRSPEDYKPQGKLLRLELDAAENLLMDGQPANLEKVVTAVKTLTGQGDCVRIPAPHSRGRRDIFDVIARTIQEMAATRAGCPGWESCSIEDLWMEVKDAKSEFENDMKVRKLVLGESFEPEAVSDAVYALQHLCELLGSELDTDDALGDLEPLQIDTPLLNWRMPVDLPQPADFPFVSYLTPDEVAVEVSRLNAMKLTFPDKDIENARKVLLKCLKKANTKQRAVVAFYY